jgi:CPA2 family monovalent cation:H+ antiporter-2
MLVDTLNAIVLAFAFALILAFLFLKLRLPVLTAFLCAGLIVGPSGFNLIKDPHVVESIAEIGVILLLFIIGIEFSVKKLLAYRREVFVAGLLQVVLTSIFSSLFYFTLVAPNIKVAIFFGLFISFSSTAVVLKILTDRGELNTPHGRYIFGILIFQDLTVVLAMLLLPMLADESLTLSEVFFKIFKAFGVLAILLLLALKLIPTFLELVIKTRSRELFLISIFLTSLGVAVFSHKLGLSLSLGAFIAGLAIAESEYAYQTIAEVKPLKDLFMALFFITIGMLLSIPTISQNPLQALIVLLFIFVLKTMVVFLVVYLLNKNLRTAFLSSFYLFQIGEFSFVLLLEGEKLNLLNPDVSQILIASSALTLFLTPLVIGVADKMTDRFLKIFRAKHKDLVRREHEKPHHKHLHRAIILGFGICGRNVAQALKLLDVPYAVIELNPNTVQRYRKRGEHIFFGDATNPEILIRYGVKSAELLIITITDPVAVRKVVKLAKELNPSIFIITRTKFVAEIDELLKLGANEVIPEEYEASIALFEKTLRYFKIPLNVINELVSDLKSEHYEALRTEVITKLKKVHPEELLKKLTFETYLVKPGHPLVGITLRALNLRAKTGATVIALKRGDELIVNPQPEIVLKEGDLLVLIGSEPQINRALYYLESPYEGMY